MCRHGSSTHWWSPGCHLSHAVLPNQSRKGFSLTINQLLPPSLASTNMRWVPVRELHAQHSLVRGEVPWLARVASGSTSSCTQKPTQTHAAVLSLLAWIQAEPPLQVTIQWPVWLVHVFSWLQPAQEMCHFMVWGSWAGVQGSSAQCQGSQPGRSRAHRLSCWKGSSDPGLLWERGPKSYKAIWQSPFVMHWHPPMVGELQPIYIHVYISVCLNIYTYAQRCVCICTCVSSLGRCIKKIFCLMK